MVTRSKTKIIILMNLENRRKSLLQVKKRLTVSLEKRAGKERTAFVWAPGRQGLCLSAVQTLPAQGRPLHGLRN